MRMARKSLQDPPRPFRGPEPAERERPSRQRAGPKKAVNVSVDAELLKIAKEIGVNISKVAEDALRKATEPERIRRWREENKEAIESYNAYIERNGIFGEELLEFDDDSPV
ncbi:MAG TPA: type II toxin-antitoxin system CcdA family antitoxin [Rhizomicrobium sp.]|jgi:antitoxin CcdA|nr:type II toxin-antitoxin system CcdA family antitoxin [Rhizomicrobium sp.]